MAPKKLNRDAWVHIRQAGWFADPEKDVVVGYSRKSKNGPSKIKDGANCVMRVYIAERYGYMPKGQTP